MKKLLGIIFTVFALFALTACDGSNDIQVAEMPAPNQQQEQTPPPAGDDREISSEESKISYTRLTQAEWDNHAGYSFFFTGVKEQSDHLLLRGFLARSFLLPEEVEYARTGIEINGEIFVFTENADYQAEAGTLRNAGYLHNIHTGDNSITLFQSPPYNEDIRYFLHLSESEHGSLPVWKMTDIFREVKVDKDTVIFVSTAFGDPAIQATAVDIFTNFTPHSFTDGLLVSGIIWFSFGYGEVIQLQGFLNPDFRWN